MLQAKFLSDGKTTSETPPMYIGINVASSTFSNYLKPTIQQLHPLHIAPSQMCGHEANLTSVTMCKLSTTK